MLAPFFGFRGLWDDLAPAPYHAPHYEATETATGLRIEIDAPRYRPNEVNVAGDAAHGTITVVAKRGPKEQHADAAAAAGEQLIVATSPLTGFQRTFRVAPTVYDVTALTTSVEHGVITILVPKRPTPPEPSSVTIFGNPVATGEATANELAAVRSSRNLMSVKKEEAGDALTYKVRLSPNVSQDHISLELKGRHLIVNIRYRSQTAHSSDSLEYSTSVLLPAETRPEDVHTTYEPGLLTVTLARPAPGTPTHAVPVAAATTTAAAPAAA